MTTSGILAITMFWIMQVIANLLFKWGSASDSRWLWGFLGGNAFGFSSIWLMMTAYKLMNPNIALGICGGGSFLLAQLALAVVFKSPVSLSQWGGVAAIAGGMILLAVGKQGSI